MSGKSLVTTILLSMSSLILSPKIILWRAISISFCGSLKCFKINVFMFLTLVSKASHLSFKSTCCTVCSWSSFRSKSCCSFLFSRHLREDSLLSCFILLYFTAEASLSVSWLSSILDILLVLLGRTSPSVVSGREIFFLKSN